TKTPRGGRPGELCANRNRQPPLKTKPPPPLSPPPPPPGPGLRRRRGPESPNPPPDELPPAPPPAARLRELAADVASALEFMSARFGPPPLATLTVSPAPGTFGQGFPGLIYL